MRQLVAITCAVSVGKQAKMQKAKKFLEPRKHFCCLRVSQKLIPAYDSVHSHATKMTSHCKRGRELQDNQTDGDTDRHKKINPL